MEEIDAGDFMAVNRKFVGERDDDGGGGEGCLLNIISSWRSQCLLARNIGQSII